MDRDIEKVVDGMTKYHKCEAGSSYTCLCHSQGRQNGIEPRVPAAELWVPRKRRSALASDQSAARRCNPPQGVLDTAPHDASTDQDYPMSTNDG